MRIERIAVDEGFLDGLELDFSPGLNVLIGPRGAGKTSIIELIRFCLSVPAITAVQDEAARAHALAVLGSGRVTVTIRDNDELIQLSRTAEDEPPASMFDYPLPLIVSQNEIEEIGLQASSRLELVDRFVAHELTVTDSASGTASIRSLTTQMASLRAEIARVKADIASMAEVPLQLAALTKQQDELGKALSATKPEQTKLQVLSSQISAARLRHLAIENSAKTLKQWHDDVAAAAMLDMDLERWPEGAGTDWLEPVRRRFSELRGDLGKIVVGVRAITAEVEGFSRRNKQELLRLDEEARALRKRLEGVQKGAGEIQKQVAGLQTQIAKTQALDASLANKLAQLERVKERRDAALDVLEDGRLRTFGAREQVVNRLNAVLEPQVSMKVEHQARHEQYISAIAAALRGTGLKYNVWAPKIAKAISPREFVRAIETADTRLLVESVDRLTDDVAAKLVSSIDAESLSSILTSPIQDDIEFLLLDGGDYKSTVQLSTGQRCTVVLPILLRQTSEPLIIDQPEDHLDNAFIVDTLVRGILEQKAKTQIICSTHNANIPVLGSAERVVLLGSDGSRAFVQHAARLEDPRSVHAITTIMEGGLEAFRRRAAFYGSAMP